ncbi:PREDICTED: uncharacterized protein LOC109166084 isoform X2 [Ipomoea nil]|uniref:uncharacterized protein LOC109166084 isoform X2 n=1 Tax=Ipomoea nil TaxID=35883 RepID=UPI0009015D03|nr:PREDICTED: uncharacterized protein LOC109166084 isoform X2 [Ipomoea nil]
MAAILISGYLAKPSSLLLPFSPKLYLSKRLSQKPHWVSLRRSTQALNRRFSKAYCLYTSGNQPDNKGSGPKWPILRRWDVPWNWQTISLSSLACGLSVSDWREPFDFRRGWLLWATIGLVGALFAIALTGVATSFLNSEPPQRETDALVRLLPLIGSSTISTASLLGITGVLAPILEETVFRGFFMVALTKWLPTPLSILLSASVFAGAHLTPGEFPQLFVLGTALGLSYAQTRNLLTPIAIHACWNSGVILLLTFLQLQGYDIKEIIQAS